MASAQCVRLPFAAGISATPADLNKRVDESGVIGANPTISRFDRPGNQEIVCSAEKILPDPPRELLYWSDSFYYMLRQWCAVASGAGNDHCLSLLPGLDDGLHVQEVMEKF
jgi:hypothetical protein